MSHAAQRLPIIFSIGAAIATLALKASAYWVTGSVGLLSDALESGINLLAALTAFISLWYASRPIDASHTYGHEKIEYFSSGLEGGLIVVAAIGIARAAISRFLNPVSLESLAIGSVIAAIAALVNFGVARYLLNVGRRYRSVILEADGHHLMTDVWTSVAMLGGLGMVAVTGYEWLDPIFALLIAANITWTGGSLIRRSFHGLMDRAIADADLALLRSMISSQLAAGTTFHAVRTRQSGSRRFADFHLLVPGDWSVRKAHELADRIEKHVRLGMAGLEITIHIEPIDEAGSWTDSAMLHIESKDETH